MQVVITVEAFAQAGIMRSEALNGQLIEGASEQLATGAVFLNAAPLLEEESHS